MPAAPAQGSPSQFPVSLDYVGKEEQIPEALGYMPGVLGALAILEAISALAFPAYLPWRSSLLCGALVAGLVLVGAGLLWWQSGRRARRRVLVRRNERVALYRKGQLGTTLPIVAIKSYRLNHGQTLIRIVCFVAVGPLFIYESVTHLTPLNGSATVPINVWLPPAAMIGASIAATVGLMIEVYYRIALLTYTLHLKEKMGDKTVTVLDRFSVTRTDAQRLFQKDGHV